MTILQEIRHTMMTDTDARATKKALKVNPNAEYLYYFTLSKREVKYLLAMDWELVSTEMVAPSGGTSLFHNHTLRKVNPARTAAA